MINNLFISQDTQTISPPQPTTPMALSTLSPPPQPPFTTHSSAAAALLPKLHLPTAATLFPANNHNNSLSTTPTPTPAALHKWRASVSFFTGLLNNNKTKNAEAIKQELLEAIAPLDRGAEATPEDQEIIDQVYVDLISFSVSTIYCSWLFANNFTFPLC